MTRKTWRVDEAYQDNSGSTTHYKRGGENTTGVNYDAIQLVFNTNGTGTNTVTNGVTYNMTWQFTSPDERNMKLVINGTIINNWSLVKITEPTC